VPPGECDWTIRLRQRCSRVSNYFDHVIFINSGKILVTPSETFHGHFMPPLPSSRHHLSYRIRGKIIRTVLCCVVYFNTAHTYEQFLKLTAAFDFL